jgi:chorismate synthase
VGNSFGHTFQISTFGESHGGAVGVVIDGLPARLAIDLDHVQLELDRRRPGQSRLTTQRDEADLVEVLSGIEDGRSTGAPLAMLVRNKDARSGAYDHLREVYRPSHADFTYDAKFGHRSIAGGGRSSARETIGRVAAGAIAMQLLDALAAHASRADSRIEIVSWVDQVHDITANIEPDVVARADVEAHPTRCPDPLASDRMTEAIEQARRDGDSLGGTVRTVVRNVPPGLGEPVFDRLEADLAKALMSLPATKGFEVGSGFAAVTMTGTTHNDAFVPGADGVPTTLTNHSGGVQGGISNGQPLLLRTAFKPTATISSAQTTVSTSGEPTTLEAKGRHDPCVLPRAVPMVDAMVALVLADHSLRQLRHTILP